MYFCHAANNGMQSQDATGLSDLVLGCINPKRGQSMTANKGMTDRNSILQLVYSSFPPSFPPFINFEEAYRRIPYGDYGLSRLLPILFLLLMMCLFQVAEFSVICFLCDSWSPIQPTVGEKVGKQIYSPFLQLMYNPGKNEEKNIFW